MLNRSAQSGGPQNCFIYSATCATTSELSINNNGRHRVYAKGLGAFCHFYALHIVHDYLAGSTRRTLDKLYCLSARRTSGAEHFNLSFVGHVVAPLSVTVPNI
jgi:hypothetical protein